MAARRTFRVIEADTGITLASGFSGAWEAWAWIYSNRVTGLATVTR